MTYSDTYNIRTTSVKFNDVADAIDGSITRGFGGTTSGTSTDYICGPTPAWTSYDTAASITIIPHVSNAAASPAITINISGLGTKVIKRGGVDLVAGVIVAGIPTILIYTGVHFEVIVAANALLRDGTNSMISDLNFGGFKPVNIAAGTAAAPAYCAGNDSNTGMFSPAADNIGFATNGSERVRIDNTGKVGIGTTSPTNALDVRGNISSGSQTPSGSVNLEISQYSNDSAGPTFQTIKSRGASVGTAGAVTSGDSLFVQQIYGNHGSGNARAAYIQAIVDSGTVSSTSMPGALIFATTPNGSITTTERIRITQSGYVGIGTTAPTANLTVGDGTGVRSIVVNGASSGSPAGSVLSTQVGGTTKVAIGNYSAIIGGAYDAAPTIYFAGGTPRVTGIVGGVGDRFMKWNTANAEWTFDTSSARFKENIVDSQYGLQAVLALRSVEFDYKEPAGRHDVGFIAEEVLNVVPEVVGLDKEGLPEAVMYDRLTSVLCKAIQELNAKVEALEAKVAVLEG